MDGTEPRATLLLASVHSIVDHLLLSQLFKGDPLFALPATRPFAWQPWMSEADALVLVCE